MITNQKFTESPTESIHPNQRDTTLTKIFVGGLPYHTNDDSLRIFFQVYGSIEEAVVITDRQTGKSRGYGFVTMSNVEDAYRAISNPNPCIDGRKANVNLAILGAKPRLLPGVNTGAVAMSRMIPIQSLVPQVSPLYNNMLNSSMLMSNMINLPIQSMPTAFNLSALRNSTQFQNSIYSAPTSSALSTALHTQYPPYLPYPISNDCAVVQSTANGAHNQGYVTNNNQYISTLNLHQQLANQTASSIGLLKSSNDMSSTLHSYPVDPSYLMG